MATASDSGKGAAARWLAFALALAGALALLFKLSGGAESLPGGNTGDAASQRTGAPAPHSSGGDGSEGGKQGRTAPATKQARARSRAQADQIRERLVVVGEGARRAVERTPESEADPDTPALEPGATPAPSQLKDRIGLDDATKQALHRDFMPLVSECIDMARDRGADMTGVLSINVGMVGDEDLGAVVDAIGFGEADQGRDVEMLECLRETALSLALPPPEQGGRADMMFTIPLAQ